MIANRDNPEVQARIQREVSENAVARSLCDALEQSPHHFEFVLGTAGMEVRVLDRLPSGLPNRARIKVFSPRPGHTLVFFYKKSLVPYSRDRYSYGGIELREGDLKPDDVAEWLVFVTSGFHPEKRPARLRRAFPYEIPE
jgi:hypothetical protein